MTIGIIGIIVALVVLVVLCVKRVNLMLSALIAAAVLCVFTGDNIYTALTTSFASGIGSFMQSWIFVFFLGSVFGKIMDITGSAQAVADWLLGRFGDTAGLILLPLVICFMVYGGVNGMVVVFTVWPMMDKIWRKIDAPRRYMPAMIQFAAGTAANGGPGSPNTLNLVATRELGVAPSAGLGIGMIYNVVVMVFGIVCYVVAVRQAAAKGQHYLAPGATDYLVEANEQSAKNKPNGLLSILPLIVTVVALNVPINGANLPNEVALLLGIIALVLVNLPRLDLDTFVKVCGDVIPTAVVLCASYGAMTGFGNVVKATPVFQMIIDNIPNIPGGPVISLMVATNIMCAVTGTATGAVSIVAPILGPIYVGMGMSAAVVARVLAMSATAFDSVPHNSGIVNYIYNFGHEDFKSAYPMVFLTSVIGPIVATVIAVLAGMALGWA